MAQTGYTPILLYSSSTASAAPVAGNLTNSTLGSELAINITDGKLFYKDNSNNIQVIGWKIVPTTAGGTGLTSYTAGDLLYYASGTTLTQLAIGTAGNWLGSSGTAPQWNAPAALTKTDDTNVTLTLGGSPSTALLNAASLTLGWTGQLAVTRGGTGLASVSQGDILYASATNTLSALAKNTTATRYLANTGTNNNPAWAQIDLSNGITGVVPVANGGTNASTASITAFNNITGYTASGATGTTSTNLVFSTSPSLTTPRVITSINDTNGNELIGVTATTSAVNEITVANAATTNSPTISATGSDTNIGIRLAPKGTGDLTLVSGNLVVANGNGVDFSAHPNAPGATSELLNDYETGTWTPTLFAGTTDFTSVTYDAATGGRYTKVGNVVHVQGFIRTDAITVGSAAGDIFIGGLPFTSAANTGVTQSGQSCSYIGRSADWAVDQPSAGRISASNTRIELFKRATSNGPSVNMAVADVGTGTDDNATFFAATYVAA